MRCYYVSDLHLESQEFDRPFPHGDVLIIAGDLCHARCLDPSQTDPYSTEQRSRTLRFIDDALRKFAQVILVAGNHEHYDGVFEDTTDSLRRHLPGVAILDNDTIEVGGVRFFGSTLWTDLSRQSALELTAIRKGLGEYFFVKTRSGTSGEMLRKLGPADTLHAHQTAWGHMRNALSHAPNRKTVIITHHAPSPLGLNPCFAESCLNPAYASILDDQIATFENVPAWVHGHTHVSRAYRIGNTVVRTNALGFNARGRVNRNFSMKACFEV